MFYKVLNIYNYRYGKYIFLIVGFNKLIVLKIEKI